MEYCLTRRVFECKTRLELTREEYNQICSAKAFLIRVLRGEERLDLVQQNYIDYETELLHIALGSALHRLSGWSEVQDMVQQVNRRVINLLSTCRLYLEHLRHEGYFKGQEPDPVKALMSAEYDSRPGYRTMEALRNHVQHRGLPLHAISLPGQWIETEQGKRRQHTTVPSLDVTILAEDDRFKHAVLADLNSVKGRVSLSPLIRDYVTGIIRIQLGLRTLLANQIVDADHVIESWIQRYRSEAEDKTIGLSAVQLNDDGTFGDHTDVFSDFIERRRMFERRNQGSGELTSLMIVSE